MEGVEYKMQDAQKTLKGVAKEAKRKEAHHDDFDIRMYTQTLMSLEALPTFNWHRETSWCYKMYDNLLVNFQFTCLLMLLM